MLARILILTVKVHFLVSHFLLAEETNASSNLCNQGVCTKMHVQMHDDAKLDYLLVCFLFLTIFPSGIKEANLILLHLFSSPVSSLVRISS